MAVEFLRGAWLLGCVAVAAFCTAVLARFAVLSLRRTLGPKGGAVAGAGLTVLLWLGLPGLWIGALLFLVYAPQALVIAAAAVCGTSVAFSLKQLEKNPSRREYAWLAGAALAIVHLAATLVWLRYG